MKLKNALIFAFLFCLAGCGVQTSTEVEKPQSEYLFTVQDEAKVYSIAYQALRRETTLKAEDIREINGPVRGFYAQHESWGKVQMTYNIRIFAANGVNTAGRNVYGYYVEVLIEGATEAEAETARRVFADIEYMLGREGSKVHVRDMERAKFRAESMGNYKSGSYDFASRPKPVAAPVAPSERIRPDAPLADPVVPGTVARPAAARPQSEPMARPAEPVAQQPKAEPAARQPEAQPAARQVSRSMADEIEKLDDLHKKGILSDDEFKRAKERVLSW